MKAISVPNRSRTVPFLVVLLWVCGPDGSRSIVGAESPKPAVHHESAVAEIGLLHGLTVPVRQVTMSAPLEGILMEVDIEEGDRVEEGQQLARMDVRVATAAVKAARLRAEDSESVRYARLALRHAKLRLKKTVESYTANAAASFEVQEGKLLVDQAQAAYEAAVRVRAVAAAALELEIQRLEQHRITAPFAGRIVRLYAQPGATLTTSDPLLTIVSLDELEAHIHLPTDQLQALQEGRVYHLEAEAPVGRVLEAKLKMMTPIIEPASRTFRCVFTIDNPDQKLPAGFAVRFVEDPEAAGAPADNRLGIITGERTAE